MVIFKRFYKPVLEIPRGVCPDCWENHLEKKMKNILEEKNMVLENPKVVLAFTQDYIKNFETTALLKNNNGTLYCPRCHTQHHDYDFINLHHSTNK